MSEFVKSTLLGYKPVPGGDSDPECTHVILTRGEYQELLREWRRAGQEKQIAEAEAAQAVRDAMDEADARVRHVQWNAEQKIAGVLQELEEERAESEYQRGLNENLLRIARERANADRKLWPKKAHSGYVVTLSAEKERRYRDGNHNWKTDVVWETVIQSPYSVDFTEGQARVQMEEELFWKDENEDGLLERLGITDGEGKNTVLERRLRANCRTGYWEMILTHTEPLGVVPAEMRAKL